MKNYIYIYMRNICIYIGRYIKMRNIYIYAYIYIYIYIK